MTIMTNYQINDKSKFSFGKKITDVKDLDFQFTETYNNGICQNCGFESTNKITYHIIKLLEIDEGKYYVGYSDKGHILQIDAEKIKELMK